MNIVDRLRSQSRLRVIIGAAGLISTIILGWLSNG